MHTKGCSLCLRIMPTPQYVKRLRRRDGLATGCKECAPQDSPTRLSNHNKRELAEAINPPGSGPPPVRLDLKVFHVCTGKWFVLELDYDRASDGWEMGLWETGGVFCKDQMVIPLENRLNLREALCKYLSTRGLRIAPEGIYDLEMYFLVKENLPPVRLTNKDWSEYS